MMTIWAVELDVDDDDEDEEDADGAALPLEVDPVLEDALEPVLDDGLDDVLVPETCCPTDRLTEATVPAMVEVRVASAREAWADDSCAWDETTLAWSAATWEADDPLAWSVASLDSSAETVASAWATDADSAVGSMVASDWPTVTV
jgi:hypothetical protein